MNISKNGIDLIKHFEGLKLKSYKCPAGIWTIGYGTTGNVKPNQVISEERAEELLRLDLDQFERAVDKLVTIELNQNQFDALVSFTYNCGIGNLQKSTLLKVINNKGSDPNVIIQFMKWVRGGGKVLPGLVKRREVESKLYCKKD